jgi:protein-S-isoprenylcysteine O-methyltransferase Ste14
MDNVLTPAALAVYLVELFKAFWRKWVAKDPTFDFPAKFLAVLLVVANYLAVILLALLGVEGNDLPTDWMGWLRALIVAMLSALVSTSMYVMGYKPFVAYTNRLKQAALAKLAKKRK